MLEPPRRGGSNEYPQSMFEQNYEQYQNFLSKNFPVLVVKFSIYLNRRVFVMDAQADLSLRWSYMPESTFSHAETHLFLQNTKYIAFL